MCFDCCMASGAINEKNFGAWLLKANPDTWDIVGFREDGGGVITSWSVSGNYRTEMMRTGDPVVFWVSGRSPDMESGIWGVGHVLTPAYPKRDDEVDDGYWLDLDAMSAVHSTVAVQIPLFEEPLPRADMKAMTGLQSLEVLRMPQGSNPSWVDADAWQVLQGVLGEPWVPLSPGVRRGVNDEFTRIESPDPATKALIEQAAIAAVKEWFGDAWSIDDVQDDNCGWDLTARNGEAVSRVEVKGKAGPVVDIFLTPNERKSADSTEGWELAVVTQALDNPTISWFSSDDVASAATAALFRLRGRDVHR